MEDILETTSFGRAFIFLCLFSFLLIFSANYILISDNLFFETFGNQLSYERISHLIESNKKWSWVIYPITPILFLVKLFLVVICLSIGAFVFNVEIPIKSLFKIAVLGEFIFFIPSVIKLFWFGLYQTNYTLQDLHYFFPFSVFSLFDSTGIEPWLLYPLQLLNLFELLYLSFMAFQLKHLLKRNFLTSFGFVASTYGSGLLIWVILIMFLTVSQS